MVPGQLFDNKYLILRVLGQGGMSKVFLAENINLGTLWVIKKISRMYSPDGGATAEAAILKNLSHHALPRVVDILTDEEACYIIFDYIEGESLDKRILRKGKIDEKTVIAWAKQLCGVLSYLHSIRPNPVIYRDMKPSNIILTSSNALKLIDFGIAREFKEDAQADTVYIGTRGYAAPEQYGTGQSNERTDIYSLGVTLYHMLTGCSPNDPPYDILPVRQIDGGLSEEIEYIISKCTKKNPADRYAAAEEVLLDLTSIEDRSPAGKTILNAPVAFRKTVLSIWGNIEFCCELAYNIVKMTQYRILLLNMDCVKGNPERCFNLKEGSLQENLKRFVELCGKDKLFGSFEEECARLYERLYIINSGNGYARQEEIREIDLTRLLENAYYHFDIVLVCIPEDVGKAAASAAVKSDYCIVPSAASTNSLRHFKNLVLYMEEKYAIPASRFIFIATEHKKGINLPLYIIRKVCRESYAGYTGYDPDRERYRDVEDKSDFYAKYAFSKNRRAFEKIIERFNILPERTFMEKMNRFLSKLAK